jgi:hypothetical protein
MKFVFALAGVPSEIYDAVRAERVWIAGDSKQTEVVLIPHGKSGSPYSAHTAKQIVDAFLPAIRLEKEKELGETCFAVLYIRGPANEELLFRELFPHLFFAPIDWALQGNLEKELRASKNDLVRPLRSFTKHVRTCLELLTLEFTEHAQQTPWLLPPRNFQSKHLLGAVVELNRSLLEVGASRQTIADRIRAFQHHHPRRRPQDSRGKSFYVDDTGMMFKPPGRELHGFFKPAEGHDDFCYLSSRRRLGSPYHRALHFDCTKDDGPTSAQLFGCHRREKAWVRSEKNINISPNDFTRPDAKKQMGS